MDLDYLKHLLHKANTLSFYQPQEGDALKIKVEDALKELNLYDVSCVKIGFLNFSRRGDVNRVLLHPDFSDSKNNLISILESKILVYEARIKKEQIKRENIETAAKKRESMIESNTLKSLKDCRELNLQYEDLIISKDELISISDEHLELLKNEIAGFPNELKKTAKLWNLYSGVFWSIILAIFIGLLVWVYDLGKDNGGKKYDTEKNALDDENNRLRNVIFEKDKEIDSLTLLVPKASPVN